MMPGNGKVFVKKKGTVCTVYEDAGSGQTLPLTAYDDIPAGGFPVTFTSVRECEARYPGKELVFVESKPSGNQKVLPKLPQKILDAESKKILGEPVSSSPPPQQAQDAEPVRETGSAIETKCKEFLDMLAMACRYASEENKQILLIKMETVEELIKHVFRR